MFKNIFYTIFILLNSCLLLFGNNPWVEWDLPKCAAWLNSDAYNKNLFKLLQFYEGRIHPTYCGVASSVIALNALSVKTSQCSRIGSYRIFTQNGFVSALIDKTIKKKDLERGGLSFNQLAGVLKTLPLYDLKSGSFLVLDVARFKYFPFWVKAYAFLLAMKTSNRFGESRGFFNDRKKIRITDGKKCK